MTSTSITNANANASTNNNWGFKTPIQFRVALRLAGAFGHLWGEGKSSMVQNRTPTPSGAVRLTEEWVHTDPATPAEAQQWAEAANANPNRIGSAYAEPTPSWESGSGSFGVSVTPSGTAKITLDGVIEVTLTPAGIPAGVKLATNWWLNWTGRGGDLGGAVKSAIETLSGGFRDPYILPASPDLAAEAIRLFEADRQFWRTCHQAGTRWWM